MSHSVASLCGVAVCHVILYHPFVEWLCVILYHPFVEGLLIILYRHFVKCFV